MSMKKKVSKFNYVIQWIDYRRVAIVIDSDEEEYTPVAENIEMIADSFNVDFVLHKNKQKFWYFWSRSGEAQSVSTHTTIGGGVCMKTIFHGIAVKTIKEKYFAQQSL